MATRYDQIFQDRCVILLCDRSDRGFVIRDQEVTMIDFEEELKNFQPSMEVEEAEAEIQKRDLTDMTDILRRMTEQAERR